MSVDHGASLSGPLFDSYAHDFAAIYGANRGPVSRLIDRYLRASMRIRFERTLAACTPVQGKRVLDIGCGPGHYAHALARLGAHSVVGIDVSGEMIELARRRSEQANVQDACTFLQADFLTLEMTQQFDFAILMGFMDYTPHPKSVVKKALALTGDRAFFSFPVGHGFLAWQRRVRYRRKTALYLYGREQIAEIFRDLPIGNLEIERIKRDYFVTATA